MPVDLSTIIPLLQNGSIDMECGSTVHTLKRAALVDELLGSSQWVDKWTLYYGDLYKNTASNTQIQLRPEGRNAFYKWIHDSLANRNRVVPAD